MRFTPEYVEGWDTLREMLAKGEHAEQDFKRSIAGKEKIAKTLTAFANGNGGRLLVGIDDNGHISGTDTEEAMYLLYEAAEHFCDPPVDLEFVVHEEEGKEVLEVTVLRSLKKPHAAKDERGEWQVYIRVGDQTIATAAERPAFWQRKITDQEKKAVAAWLKKMGSITLDDGIKLLALSRSETKYIFEQLLAEGVLVKKTKGVFSYYVAR